MACSKTERWSVRPPGAGRRPDLRRLPPEVSTSTSPGAMSRPWPAAGLKDGGVLKAGRRAPPNSDRLQRLCSPAHERGHDRDGRLCGVGQCDILELVANQAAHRSPPLAATCVADGRGSPVAGDRRRQPVRPPGARRRPDPIAADCRRRLGILASGERGQCRGPHVAGIGGRSSANATGALEVGHRAQFKSCAWRQACVADALKVRRRAQPVGRAWRQAPALQARWRRAAVQGLRAVHGSRYRRCRRAPWPGAGLRDRRCDLPALAADLTYAGCRWRCPRRRLQERWRGRGLLLDRAWSA